MHGALITPRVQVPNNHILSRILTYITTVLWTLGVTLTVLGRGEGPQRWDYGRQDPGSLI